MPTTGLAVLLLGFLLSGAASAVGFESNAGSETRTPLAREYSLTHLSRGDFPARVLVRPADYPKDFEQLVETLRTQLHAKPKDRSAKLEVLDGGRVKIVGTSETHQRIEAHLASLESPEQANVSLAVQRVDLSSEAAEALGLEGAFEAKALTKRQWKTLEESARSKDSSAEPGEGDVSIPDALPSRQTYALRWNQLSNVRYDLSTKESPLEPLVTLEFKLAAPSQDSEVTELEWKVVAAHPHAKYKLAKTTSKPRWQAIERHQGRLGLRLKPEVESRFVLQGARQEGGVVTVLAVTVTLATNSLGD